MNSDMVDLTISAAPHVRDKIKTPRLMRDVIIALLPATIGGLVIFGLRHTLGVIVVSVVSAIAAEYIGNVLFRRKNSIKDLSASVTGLLLALILPPTSPYWMVVVGAFSAILLGKAIFGSVGSNPFNPALVGRAVLMVSWTTFMTTWVKPFYWRSMGAMSTATMATVTGVDAVTTATPLSIIKFQGLQSLLQMFGSRSQLYLALFLGNRPGCIGETSVLLLLIGGVYLILRKVIDWKIPLCFIGSVFILSFIFGRDPIFSILSGGLFLGAFFMATDYSSSPLTSRGKLLYGIFLGFITVIIRQFGPYPEGVMFSILLGNMVVPYFDKLRPYVYGVFKRKGEA